MREQRRGKKIAMSAEEVDAYLRTARTCHAATVLGDGAPHVSPLWFVWDGQALWLNSVVKSQRWANLMRDQRVAVVVDGGEGFMELHGVEIHGRVEVVGDVPRSATPMDETAVAEQLWGDKYMGGRAFIADGGHAWLRVSPEKLVSWDFRKMGG